jgi:hypothetical protein
MSNYIGVKCPVCGVRFTKADDIVVCPVCGAPHHRACYAAKAECAFAAEHLSGKEWRPPQAKPEDAYSAQSADRDVAACPACGAKNPPEVIFCQVCGRAMSAHGSEGEGDRPGGDFGFKLYGGLMRGFDLDPVSLVYGGLSPDEQLEDKSVRDVAVFVGENSAYYLPRFKEISQKTRPFSFNLSAMVFSFLYFFNRKMYLVGGFLLALFVAVKVPDFLRAQALMPELMRSFGFYTDIAVNRMVVDHYTRMGEMTNLLYMFVVLGTSFFANRLYYDHVVRGIDAVRGSLNWQEDTKAYNFALSRRGGVSKAAVIAVVCGISAAVFIVASIMSYGYLPY